MKKVLLILGGAIATFIAAFLNFRFSVAPSYVLADGIKQASSVSQNKNFLKYSCDNTVSGDGIDRDRLSLESTDGSLSGNKLRLAVLAEVQPMLPLVASQDSLAASSKAAVEASMASLRAEKKAAQVRQMRRRRRVQREHLRKITAEMEDFKEEAKAELREAKAERYTDPAQVAPDGYNWNIIEDPSSLNLTCYGNFQITYYCCERYPHICGEGKGITSSGRQQIAYWSAAVDTSIIPHGTLLAIDFGDGVLYEFSADDTGSMINDYHIDISVQTHEEALAQKKVYGTVYVINP